MTLDRRALLRHGAGLGAGIAFLPVVRAAESCGLTPPQVEGPFYPRELPAEADADLTQLAGRKDRALGSIVVVMGVVTDEHCRPVAGATVDVWQANAAGRYAHPADPSDAPLDPGFQGFARLVTGPDGKYRFTTIRPGAYPASRSWMRPPHIHFQVTAPGRPPLTTQMYFAAEALNEKDHFIQELSPEGRKALVIRFEKPEGADRPTGVFPIVLGPEGKPGTTPRIQSYGS